MAIVLSYRPTMEAAAALILFVDVHRRPCKTNLPNVNIVWRGAETSFVVFGGTQLEKFH